MASAIESRESFLYVLHEEAERALSGDTSKKPKKFQPILNSIRSSSFDVVEQMDEWRKHLGYDAIYLWRGTSYLCKMATDLNFLVNTPLLPKVQCQVVGNPFLNPQRQADRPQTSPDTLETQQTMTGGKPSLPALKYRTGTAAGPFGAFPMKKTNEGASALLFPQERYADAEAILRAEPELFRKYLATARSHSFDDPAIENNAEIDPFIAKSLEAVRFVPENLQEALEEANEQASEARIQAAAATKIQRVCRGIIGRKAARELRKQHDAARKLQGMYRYWFARKRHNLLKTRYQAAIKIQAISRGIAVRQRHARQQRENAAAARIQGLYRGFAARRFVTMWRAVWTAAIRIQRTFRSHTSRKQTTVYKSVKYNTAACEIQKVWKGLRLRESGQANPKMLKAAVTIQRYVRGWIARRWYRNYLIINRRAAKVQAVMRGHAERQKTKQMLDSKSFSLDAASDIREL